jgi:hypothetical protein
MSNDRTTAHFNLGEAAPIRTTWRTLIVLMAFLATGFGSWVLLRADVQDHEKRLGSVESRLSSDHDILLEIRADLKALTREQRRERDDRLTR